MRWLVPIFACAMAFGQGYERTSWGMTLQQVMKAYPAAPWEPIEAADEASEAFVLRLAEDIAAIPCQVEFKFTRNSLVLVEVSARGRPELPARATLLRHLVAQFGQGLQKEGDTHWQYGDTTIVFSFRYFVAMGHESMTIQYRPTVPPLRSGPSRRGA